MAIFLLIGTIIAGIPDQNGAALAVSTGSYPEGLGFLGVTRGRSSDSIWLKPAPGLPEVTLVRAPPGWKVDGQLSPDGKRLLVVEWSSSAERPAAFESRVSIFDMATGKCVPLLGPERFAALPMWKSSNRLGVLLDGTQAVTLSVDGKFLGGPFVLGVQRVSLGNELNDDEDLLLRYLFWLKGALAFKREQAIILRVARNVGIEQFHREFLSKVDRQLWLRFMVRSMGLSQFPDDSTEPRYSIKEVRVSPDERYAAFYRELPSDSVSPPRNEVGIVGVRGWQTVSRHILHSADMFRFNWSQDSRRVTCTVDGQMRPEGAWEQAIYCIDRARGTMFRVDKGFEGWPLSRSRPGDEKLPDRVLQPVTVQHGPRFWSTVGPSWR